MTQPQEEYKTDAPDLPEARQIVTEVSGFIPIFDIVAEFYDNHMTALVFGRMWNYCGMSDGVCRAGLERLASDMKISRATVIRHIELLCADGFMIDLTPDRRNRPHEYKDGGKVVMKSQLSAVGVSQKNRGVSQKNTRVSERYLIKEDNTKDKSSTAAEFHDHKVKSNTFAIYEQNIGALTPLLSDELAEVEKEDTQGLFEDAVKEALSKNVRNLKYIKAILARWRIEGRGDNRKKAESETAPTYKVYDPSSEPVKNYVPAPENLRRSHAAE